MKLLDILKQDEHNFTAWVAKEYQDFRNEEPTLIKVSDRVYPYVKSAVQIAIGFESPAVAALAGPIIDKIHAGLDTAAGLVYDFGATPDAAGVLSTVQSQIGSLETVAGIKSDGAKNAISKGLSALNGLIAAITGTIDATKAPVANPVPVVPPASSL